jgi:4-amino-4-deoxy-L-arabinose transferase-like glycosyltransferase
MESGCNEILYAQRKQIPSILIVLLLALFSRGVSLEYGDLVDPTETRYATIAENMLISGDWVTPRLPTENGLEPYLSKPPLHFWLTTLSYKIFGIDEWTSRLPSFLGLLLIIGSAMVFASKFFNKESGYIAGVICTTSPLVFFLSGSSTVDITFAGFINVAVVAFVVAVKNFEDKHRSLFASVLFFVSSAFAFLTKGPSAVVLIGLPIAALCYFDRNLKCLRALPWISGSLLFFAICTPWFYLLEKANPGSVQYFFVHENLLRFMATEYGGKYGDAHTQPYGTIWWIFLISILPWSFYLLHSVRKHIKMQRAEEVPKAQKRWIFFLLACGLSPMLFFTFARSILPAYVVPAIPGFALYIGYFVSAIRTVQSEKGLTGQRFRFHALPCIGKVGIGMLAFMMIAFLIAVPMIQVNKSSSELLEVIATQLKHAHPIVATVSTRNYSPYWTAGAHEEELPKSLQIVYANATDIKRARYKNVIVREKDGSTFLASNSDNYEKRESRGSWHWYRRLDNQKNGAAKNVEVRKGRTSQR